MNHSLYIIGQLIIILLVFGLLSSLVFGLRFAFARMHMKLEKRKQFIGYILAGCLFWLSILTFLSFSGFFQNFESFPPRVVYAFVPPLLIIVVLLFSRFFAVILKAIPERWLIYIQAFRILMELFLWMGYHGGYIPLQMTFEWLNYDIIVGITALMAGYVFFGKGRFRWPEAILWNVFGIVLLVNIVLIALLSAPTPFRVFLNEPSNTFVAQFPFIWIPGFIVPFALAMHLFSLKQIAMGRKRGISVTGRREFGRKDN